MSGVKDITKESRIQNQMCCALVWRIKLNRNENRESEIVAWPSQDILLLRGFCTPMKRADIRVNPVALLLHYYCAIYDPLRPPICMLYNMQYW